MIEYNEPEKHLSEMPIFELITSYRETTAIMKELSMQYLYIAEIHKEKFEGVFGQYEKLKTDIAFEIADRMTKEK